MAFWEIQCSFGLKYFLKFELHICILLTILIQLHGPILWNDLLLIQ